MIYNDVICAVNIKSLILYVHILDQLLLSASFKYRMAQIFDGGKF